MKTWAGAALGALLVLLWALSIESAPSVVLSEAVAAGSLPNQEADFPLRALNLELGIRDHEPTQWDGSMRISQGQIIELRGHHFSDEAELVQDHSWEAATSAWPESRGTMHLNELPVPHATRAMIVGVTVYYRAPDDARLEVKTEQGDFAFRVGDVPETTPLYFLVTRVKVSRVPPVEHLTTEEYEDDYPSIVENGEGHLYFAWIGYREERDRVLFRRAQNGIWGKPVEVTREPGDLFGTEMAIDEQGRAWIVWSQRAGTDWYLKGRWFDGSSWGDIVELTSTPGNHLFHRLAADDRGRLHLVWQAGRGGRFDIHHRTLEGGRWSAETVLSDPGKSRRTNDWHPHVAVDSRGVAWVVWDTYDGGSYNIRMRSIREGHPGSILRVTDSARFHAYPSVAVDALDRVWVAYDLAEENWGKDTGFLLTGGTGLYEARRIGVAIYDGSRWLEPRDRLGRLLPPGLDRYSHSPRLTSDSQGRMWIAFQTRTVANRSETNWGSGTKWEVMASFYDGDQWSHPILIPESVGRNGRPVDTTVTSQGEVYLAWVTDQRLWGNSSFGDLPRDNQILIADVANQLKNKPSQPPVLGPRGGEAPTRLPTEPREQEQVASLRDYAITAGDKTYRIYRGDLHRHTDISVDGAGEGSLFDSYRYMLDAAAMDFYMVSDHNSGEDQEYTWWRIEKSEDMFHLPGFFVTLFGYERSVSYPNGHRNIVYARRGNRTLPITEEERESSSGPFLYPHLRATNGIAIPHTSHTYMGTDWRDNDPELEPVVEIFQGARTSAEHPGAPLASAEDRTDLWAGSYRPLGFVWEAWAKGYKLGVQASSDHISTHTSYAMILAEDFTREGLLEAMRQRHTYGATSNILLNFRLRDGSADHIHGDSFATTRIPTLYVKTIGTSNIKEIVLVRDNQYVFRRPGSGERMEFTFLDSDLEPGEHYYYVRVEQHDRNLAWASPIWVKLR